MQLLTTPLTEWHAAHKAKMAPFAGFSMPIQYEGILAEHEHTRTRASVFDICHMGEFSIQGPGARESLERLVTHDLSTLAPGRCRYGFLLNHQGGILDDLIVYCLGPDDYFLVVNGARIESDRKWLEEHLGPATPLADISNQTAKIDLQGPSSLEALEQVLPGPWRSLRYFGFTKSLFAGSPLMVSRTGYTGELGYELYLSSSLALDLWERLVAHPLVKPAGLGARDTLRLEMGLPLYGHDLDEMHTPTEAGYGMLLTNLAEYIGKGKDKTVRQRLLGLTLDGRRSAREGNAVLTARGEPVGRVTSGSFAPSLGYSIALAYVEAEKSEEEEYLVDTGRAQLPAKRSEMPFYKQGTARRKVE